MSKGIYTSLTVEGEAELNVELRRMGIPHTIGDLFHDNTLCQERGPELLDSSGAPCPSTCGQLWRKRCSPEN